ncbi:MAG: hypothetical protein J5634_01605 [Bacilli bacterium]|nr:hypothetical protein [Bacilli bacterium]
MKKELDNFIVEKTYELSSLLFLSLFTLFTYNKLNHGYLLIINIMSKGM